MGPMARLPRLIVPGLPHLVSQRAQHGQAMVRDDEDRRALLRLLREAAAQHRVALHAYSVLEGRLDLVATPETANGLSLLMQSVARRHRRIGSAPGARAGDARLVWRAGRVARGGGRRPGCVGFCGCDRSAEPCDEQD